jgi:D-2-hydroxyacid dehydrogenase (NADP+)
MTRMLVASGLWKNDLLPQAKKPKYLRSVSAGTNQYDLDAFRTHGIHLASGQGVNTNAVSEHAPGVMLLLIRGLALARDNSQTHLWRREQTNPALREDELAGDPRHQGPHCQSGQSSGYEGIGMRRNPASGRGAADEVHNISALKSQISRADVLVLR